MFYTNKTYLNFYYSAKKGVALNRPHKFGIKLLICFRVVVDYFMSDLSRRRILFPAKRNPPWTVKTIPCCNGVVNVVVKYMVLIRINVSIYIS